MRTPADDESLIQMRAMRGEDVFAFERAADERDARVHDERPHQERAEHERVAALIGREQRQNRECITEKRAGNVAHKNFCGRPIVREKTQTARGDGKRDRKHKTVAHVRREHHPAQPARKRDAARDAVNAVHEVVGVGESDDPQKRDDDSDNAQLQFAEQRDGDRFEKSQPIDRDRRDESLHRKANL